MSRFRGKRPSAGTIIAGTALVIALAGTAIAAPVAIKSALNKQEKKQVKKIAANQVNKLASGLSVSKAKTAETAANAEKLANLTVSQVTPAAGVNEPTDKALTDNYAPLLSTTITVAVPSTLLANASVHLDSNGGNNDRGDCRFSVDGSTTGIGYSTDVVNNDETMPVTQSATVATGAHTVVLECLKNVAGDITVRNSAMTVSAHPN